MSLQFRNIDICRTVPDVFLKSHVLCTSPVCTFRLLRWSQARSSAVGSFSFSWLPPLPSATWEVWLEHLSVRTAKKASEYLSLLHIPGNISFWRGPTIFLFSLLSLTHLQKIYFVVFDILAGFNSTRVLSFPTWSLSAQAISLYSSKTTCPCFRPLPFNVWICPGAPLFIHAGLLGVLPHFFVGMHDSWAGRKWSFNTDKHSSAPSPSRALSYSTLLSRSLESKASSAEVQIAHLYTGLCCTCPSALRLYKTPPFHGHCSQGCPFEIHVPHQPLLLVENKVQLSTSRC